jgi:hypothetical protein
VDHKRAEERHRAGKVRLDHRHLIVDREPLTVLRVAYHLRAADAVAYRCSSPLTHTDAPERGPPRFHQLRWRQLLAVTARWVGNGVRILRYSIAFIALRDAPSPEMSN